MNKDFSLTSVLNVAIIAAVLSYTAGTVAAHQIAKQEILLQQDVVKATTEMVVSGVDPFAAQCSLKQHTTKICEQFLRNQKEGE